MSKLHALLVDLPSGATSTHGKIDNHVDPLISQEIGEVMKFTSFIVDVIKSPLNSFDLGMKRTETK